MLYIFGVDLSSKKRNPLIRVALTQLYGIGHTSAQEICTHLKLDPATRLTDLSEIQVARICKLIEMRYVIEGDLRKNQSLDINRLVEIKSYRGKRHVRSMPVRGQRTHTNRKTARRLNSFRTKSKKK